MRSHPNPTLGTDSIGPTPSSPALAQFNAVYMATRYHVASALMPSGAPPPQHVICQGSCPVKIDLNHPCLTTARLHRLVPLCTSRVSPASLGVYHLLPRIICTPMRRRTRSFVMNQPPLLLSADNDHPHRKPSSFLLHRTKTQSFLSNVHDSFVFVLDACIFGPV